jgi:hypothetical protein
MKISPKQVRLNLILKN